MLGTAYSTRARFEEDGQAVEEIRIFAVHPAGNRLLHMTYRYEPAAGQTQARMMDQAFEAFGYIEPLTTTGEETDAGEGGAGEDGAGEDGAGENAADGAGTDAAAGDGTSS